MPSVPFQKLLDRLSPETREDLPLRVPEAVPVEICWHLLAVPHDSLPDTDPIVEVFATEEQLQTRWRELVQQPYHCFGFFGTRVYTTEDRQEPYLLLPGGRAVPLFNTTRQIRRNEDGFMGPRDSEAETREAFNQAWRALDVHQQPVPTPTVSDIQPDPPDRFEYDDEDFPYGDLEVSEEEPGS